MNWRPGEKEWIKKRSKYFEHNQPKAPYYKIRLPDYEAGADAMLEALRDARFPYTGGQFAGLEIAEDGKFSIILKK